MNLSLRKIAVALAATAAFAPAQAGVLKFQDVVFTTTWTSNVLTLEIDAAKHSGDWSKASTLGALSLKDIGSFQSVTVTSAPKGAAGWTMKARELNARGCAGGGASRTTTALCLSGAPIALSDNMVFTFTFSGGAPDLDEPHLKVNFLDASNNKVGDLLSKKIVSAPVVVAEPAPAPAPSPAPAPVPAPVPEPVVPAPVPAPAPEPAAPVPATSPASGNTTVPAPESQVVVNQPADPEAPVQIPAPPAAGVTEPVLVLQPVAQPASSEVPEPAMPALLLGGLALMGVALRKRR